MKKKKLLFVCYGALHVNSFIPVLKRLKSDSSIDSTVLALTTAAAALKREGIDCIGFQDLMRSEDKARFGDIASLLSTVHHPDISATESEAYMGLSYLDLCDRLGPDEAERQFSLYGRNSFFPLTVMTRFIRELAPDIVLATTAPRAERAAIEVAADLGIPSICLLNALPAFELEWIKQPHYGTKVCVLCDSVAEQLVVLGRARSSIVVTGDPGLDYLAHRAPAEEVADFRRQRGIDDRKIIFFASQPEPATYDFTGEKSDPRLPRRIDSILCSFLPRHEDWFVIVRLHPSEASRPTNLPDRASEHLPHESLKTLLCASDVILTFSSNVGIEAALIGKPVLRLMCSVHTRHSPLHTYNFGFAVNDLADLEQAIVDSLDSAGPDPLEQKYNIGHASEAVVAVIEQMLK